MREICIIDTSIFCDLLEVPHKKQNPIQAKDEFEIRIQQQTDFLLPITTIYETGNHIAQIKIKHSGDLRWKLAKRFVAFVQGALAGEAPWKITPLADKDKMGSWLSEFPEKAKAQMGFGDLAIVKIWQEQCQLNQGRRVYIWSYDKHLMAYDRPATI